MHKVLIKSMPRDFIVKEAADIPLRGKGAYAVYMLTKEGWNTVDALQELSRRMRVPYERFAYGGRKDRHGHTSQHISIRNGGRQGIQGPGYALEFLGFSDRPMAPDLITRNEFKVTVRGLTGERIALALPQLGDAGAHGFENYFDDQRFGSYDPLLGFYAEKALKGHYYGCLKAYLTHAGPQEKKEERERKQFFSEHWKEWAACEKRAKTLSERKLFSYLAGHPTGALEAARMIPREDFSVGVGAYQAFLWNEVVRRASASQGQCRSYPGAAGEYLFSAQPAWLSGVRIPVPGAKMGQPPAGVAACYAQVMSEHGITRALFNKMKVRQAYFKSFERDALAYPQGLRHAQGDDELHPGMMKLALSFSLPRGSFATMLVKRIFSG